MRKQRVCWECLSSSSHTFLTFCVGFSRLLSLVVATNNSRGLKIGLSFDATIAFSLGIERIASLEAETTGLNVGSLAMSIEGYSVIESMCYLLVDGVIYYFLGRYFDQVIPKSYGLSQPWYFLFSPAFWRGEMVQKKVHIERSEEDKR